ncbi:MAG: hydrogenase maturation nickel metallochaperone HypA [Promethearchaeota archaeon]|jgi:hydrogenase nickel incorporation protein HypA/HybF|nr:MAG: hydrogenase maturation nickel metallochaperone HypA [Candidatus Lokiarchaeota archaeon]
MHEFSFAYNIFKVAEATALKYNAKKISEVYLEIGELTLIVPHLLRESFKMATHGSIAEGAELKIEIVPGKIRCRDCNKISTVTLNEEAQLTGLQLFQCKFCQSKNTEIIDGKKANVKNIKIQE